MRGQTSEIAMPPVELWSPTPALPVGLATADAHPPSAAHLRAVVNRLSGGVFTFTDTLDVTFRNATLLKLLGLPLDAVPQAATLPELLQSSPALDADAAEAALDLCKAAVARAAPGVTRITVPASLAGGPYAASPHAASPRTFSLELDSLGDGTWMALLQDVTDHLAAEAAIEQALHDAVTGLPTRRLFEGRVRAGLTEHGRLALLTVELDRFKAVNETLGHTVGDALLALVAKRLRSITRDRDVVARLGSDEFGMLICHVLNPTDLAQLGQRIIDVVSRPYLVHGQIVNIGASVGIATAPKDATGADQLMTYADLALYGAKRAGHGSCCFYAPEMNERAKARRALEIDLRKALALRELELHYQPQVEFEHERCRLTGFECLLRWRNPARGLVPPADFIPLAEELGIIVPIGEWVLREACLEAARWPDDLSVAVNVSSRQFDQPANLVEAVARALELAELPGHRLEIEITESVLLRNGRSTLDALHHLRARGVRIAMDDFGTGYSSLSQLRSFPFDKIKIDRSFVGERVGLQGSQDAIIRAIAALGDSLGMSTIAEGVETADQLTRIRAEGCTSVQGYLFSRPIPADAIDALIASFPCRSEGPGS